MSSRFFDLEAVMSFILRAQQTHNFDAKKIAHDIRPLIGLTSRQVEANAKYRQKIFDQYVEHGASAKVAAQRAEKAALKYASKQHRYRAETIVHTELAFAYNQGAHVGVLQAINAGFMGRCAMVWTTAGTNRVCPRCLALKGTIVGHTNESGVTLPPIHPRCRCTIEYREVEPPKVLTAPASNGNVTSMSTVDDTPKWSPRNKANIIAKEEYVKLRELAAASGIALAGVKNFDGSVEVVREVIETLAALQETFPAVRDERYKLTLEMKEFHNPKEYASTNGKIITLNTDAYRDVELLATEYQKDIADGWFVKGTTYRAIPHHEFGHVVADVYKIDPLKIACAITGLKPKEVLPYVTKNLSKYAGGFSDGREIISEVFADVSTGEPCEFSRKFYDKVLELTRGDENAPKNEPRTQRLY